MTSFFLWHLMYMMYQNSDFKNNTASKIIIKTHLKYFWDFFGIRSYDVSLSYGTNVI